MCNRVSDEMSRIDAVLWNCWRNDLEVVTKLLES